ncbi:MAG: hypothetical protein HY943_08140 [Gammaproteobacteria bacterium]|nr:hypothetical protein [Gammaproteobacteria bacterium]
MPRRLTFEVPERIDAEGGVVRVLDEDEVRRILGDLAADDIEAIAVCLLWSIANPVHEKRVGELIVEPFPGVPYTLSHELNPIIREYPRASAIAIDASLKPLMQEQLRLLEQNLAASGYTGDLLVSASIGGVMHVEDMIERPIYFVKSGPAITSRRSVRRASGNGACRRSSSNTVRRRCAYSSLPGSTIRSGAECRRSNGCPRAVSSIPRSTIRFPASSPMAYR